MNEFQYIYIVRCPLAGQPDGFYNLATCTTYEIACEVCRVLLSTHDPQITEVRIVRQLQL
jgi:hypothetical protein